MLAEVRLGQSTLTFSSSSCTPKLCPKYVRALACELEASAAAEWHLLAACSMPCDQKAGETPHMSTPAKAMLAESAEGVWGIMARLIHAAQNFCRSSG